MPRINQLPAASSVAQTDVLAIDTTDKTYKVPRSVLAPAPYIATIPTGQWSGSGSDRYITVTASNVTANAMLYPFFDNASAALLNGPVWVIPAAGSFTIHTSAIPSGTVTISVLLAGIVGEAQYQVLADVYSMAQVDSIVAQSTANKALSISLTSSMTTWAEIYNQISTIPSGATAGLYSAESLSTILTDGKLLDYTLVGTITRAGSTYTFLVSAAGGSAMFTFRLTNCSASGKTVGTIRRYVGTDL